MALPLTTTGRRDLDRVFEIIESRLRALEQRSSLSERPAPLPRVEMSTPSVVGDFTIGGELRHQGSRIGFYGTAPVDQPAVYTQTYNTATRTLGAYTSNAQGSAYTGAADGEAKLADLNALRAAYENLRAFAENIAQVLNSLIDDGQSIGMSA